MRCFAVRGEDESYHKSKADLLFDEPDGLHSWVGHEKRSICEPHADGTEAILLLCRRQPPPKAHTGGSPSLVCDVYIPCNGRAVAYVVLL